MRRGKPSDQAGDEAEEQWKSASGLSDNLIWIPPRLVIVARLGHVEAACVLRFLAQKAGGSPDLAGAELLRRQLAGQADGREASF